MAQAYTGTIQLYTVTLLQARHLRIDNGKAQGVLGKYTVPTMYRVSGTGAYM